MRKKRTTVRPLGQGHRIHLHGETDTIITFSSSQNGHPVAPVCTAPSPHLPSPVLSVLIGSLVLIFNVSRIMLHVSVPGLVN